MFWYTIDEASLLKAAGIFQEMDDMMIWLPCHYHIDGVVVWWCGGVAGTVEIMSKDAYLSFYSVQTCPLIIYPLFMHACAYCRRSEKMCCLILQVLVDVADSISLWHSVLYPRPDL